MGLYSTIVRIFLAQFYILIKSEHFCPFKRTALKIQNRSLEFTRNRLIGSLIGQHVSNGKTLVDRVQAVGPGCGHTRLYRFGVEPRICISKLTYDADAPGLKTVISIGPVYPISIPCGVGRRNKELKQGDCIHKDLQKTMVGVRILSEGSRQLLKVQSASRT